MPSDPTLTNEQAKKEWAWICATVGEHTARSAIALLPGGRKPYPLNIARALGLHLPRPEKLPELVVIAEGESLEAGIALVRNALRPN